MVLDHPLHHQPDCKQHPHWQCHVQASSLTVLLKGIREQPLMLQAMQGHHMQSKAEEAALELVTLNAASWSPLASGGPK